MPFYIVGDTGKRQRNQHSGEELIESSIDDAERMIRYYFDMGYGWLYTIVDAETHEPVKQIEDGEFVEAMMNWSNEVPADWRTRNYRE